MRISPMACQVSYPKVSYFLYTVRCAHGIPFRYSQFAAMYRDFLHQCFQRETTDQSSAEVLCEYTFVKTPFGRREF